MPFRQLSASQEAAYPFHFEDTLYNNGYVSHLAGPDALPIRMVSILMMIMIIIDPNKMFTASQSNLAPHHPQVYPSVPLTSAFQENYIFLRQISINFGTANNSSIRKMLTQCQQIGNRP